MTTASAARITDGTTIVHGISCGSSVICAGRGRLAEVDGRRDRGDLVDRMGLVAVSTACAMWPSTSSASSTGATRHRPGSRRARPRKRSLPKNVSKRLAGHVDAGDAGGDDRDDPERVVTA